MNKNQRLIGIDLFRGIAIYAVVILHSDGVTKVIPPAWGMVRNFAGFAVPFFLATSFYLSINKLYTKNSNYQLKPRLERLLIPYLAWTLVYCLYKITKYLIDFQPERLHSLFKDPIAIFFLGGAALHLYFIPLLLVGTFSIKGAEYFIKRKISLKFLGVILFFSLVVYELILKSGNSFQISSNIAFEPLLSSVNIDIRNHSLLRLLIVEFSWFLRCLPYILVAMIICHPASKIDLISLINCNFVRIAFLLVIFLIFNGFGEKLLPESCYEIGRGYLALMTGIAVSRYIGKQKLVNNLGLCSFGIYLLHLLVVDFLQVVMLKLYPNFTHPSTQVLVVTSAFYFFISWSIASFLIEKKNNKLLFGI
jgi:fucose 4-O-acetylase-like acetyltransferase